MNPPRKSLKVDFPCLFLWKLAQFSIILKNFKVGCVFLMVAVRMLPQAEFGRNDHREYALHLRRSAIKVYYNEMNQYHYRILWNSNLENCSSIMFTSYSNYFTLTMIKMNLFILVPRPFASISKKLRSVEFVPENSR